MKVYHNYLNRPTPEDMPPEELDLKTKVVVPGDAYSIRDLLVKFSNGVSPVNYLEGEYYDDDMETDFVMSEIDKMDISEAMEYSLNYVKHLSEKVNQSNSQDQKLEIMKTVEQFIDKHQELYDEWLKSNGKTQGEGDFSE